MSGVPVTDPAWLGYAAGLVSDEDRRSLGYIKTIRCPEFITFSANTGLLAGLSVGSIQHMLNSRKYHQSLPEFISNPQGIKVKNPLGIVPLTLNRLSFLGLQSIRGAGHGALFSSLFCFTANNYAGNNDVKAFAITSFLTAAVGPIICKNFILGFFFNFSHFFNIYLLFFFDKGKQGSLKAWLTAAAIISLFAPIVSYNPDFIKSDISISEEGRERALARHEERKAFYDERVVDKKYY